jgi:hypothetical protein
MSEKKECPHCLSLAKFVGDNLVSFECFTHMVKYPGDNWRVNNQSWECVIKERDRLRAAHAEGLHVDTIASLHRIWLSHNPPRYEWSEDTPTGEGWFWLLRGAEANIVRVRRQRAYGNRLCAHIKPEGELFVITDIPNALWSGPILQPVEP